MLEGEFPRRPESSQPVRNLKIEADGDRWKGIKPKIRLMGRWLEGAGFKPGGRVQVTCVAPGIIELRSAEPTLNEATPEPGLSEHPF
ncbi:MAG: SymE family type I addiction module toxin [Verrucomicrobiota bacterium]